MKTYKNKNQKRNIEVTTILFIKTNEILNSKYFVECNESEIYGDYLGKEIYTENGIEIIKESWGWL